MVPSAVLPNPAEPGFIGIGAILGGLGGRAIARALRYDSDKCTQWAVDGSFYGAIGALGVYLIANFLELGVI